MEFAFLSLLLLRDLKLCLNLLLHALILMLSTRLPTASAKLVSTWLLVLVRSVLELLSTTLLLASVELPVTFTSPSISLLESATAHLLTSESTELAPSAKETLLMILRLGSVCALQDIDRQQADFVLLDAELMRF